MKFKKTSILKNVARIAVCTLPSSIIRGFVAIYVLLVGTLATSLGATATNEDAAVENAIRQAGQAYVAALERGDKEALLSLWTEVGTYSDATGRSFSAHEIIKQQFLDPSAKKMTPVAAIDDSGSTIRFVAPNVAIEEGPCSSPNAREAAGGFTAIWVKGADGGWRLDNLAERATDPSSQGSPLDGLSWMIGNWRGKGEDFNVTCSTRWSDGRKFVISQFTVERAGEVVTNSVQRIAWDPAKQRIRSWVFHSDGGIFEGQWLSEGNAWIERKSGTLPDGNEMSSINFWLPEGEDRCVLKSSHIVCGDESMADKVVVFDRINREGELDAAE